MRCFALEQHLNTKRIRCRSVSLVYHLRSLPLNVVLFTLFLLFSSGLVRSAENDTHYFFDVSSSWGSITTWSSYSSHDAGDVYVTQANANNGNWSYIGLGCTKNSSATATMGSTVATTYPTKKITVHVAMYRDANYLSITSAKIYVYSSYNSSSHAYSSQVDVIDVISQYTAETNSSAITIEATPTSGTTWSSGVYFQLQLGVSNSHTGDKAKAHRTGIDKFFATEGASAGSTKTLPYLNLPFCPFCHFCARISTIYVLLINTHEIAGFLLFSSIID